MKGMDTIIAKIAEEAGLDAAKVLDEARAQAAEVLKGYEEKASAVEAGVKEQWEKTAQAAERKLVSEAQLEGRKVLLEKKQQLLAQAFDKALAELLNLPEDKYIAFMANMAVSAGDGAGELIFGAEEKAAWGAKVVKAANALRKEKGIQGDLVLSEKTGSEKGGMIISKGDVEINCSMNALVQMEKETLAAEVSKVLFG
ncbi:MAG: hypothetical protein E7223_02470 [Clostridiales bacterium]|nr:hypothetical protein [Clostridiales bacterium]